MRRARFVVEPELFISHTPERSFIGPGMVRLKDGDILMAAPWGRPPVNFEQLAARYPVPMLYRSSDGGRSWREDGRMRMAWHLPGMISDGGITFIYLRDGRLAFLAHRHVEGQHGGGLPVFATSDDDGRTWTPARVIGETEGVWYVMNDRMIHMRSGRLVVPVSHMASGMGAYEGDRNVGLCLYSDDGGESWRQSRTWADVDDQRGMAEPCVAEVAGGRLIMLARTGSGCHYRSWSDDGGESWSMPEPTSLTAACSPLTLKSLPDGRLILFYNHAEPLRSGAFFPRTPLAFAFSSDGGQSWSEPVMVDDEGVEALNRQHIYPSVCFTDEGMLVMYSTHAADPAGAFGKKGEDAWKLGGGKRCVLTYPEDYHGA